MMLFASKTFPRFACALLGGFLAFGSDSRALAEGKISFSREIQPILAKACFACHGPDESSREADLLLSNRQVAVNAGAIVPGKPAESEMIRRINSDDEFEQMPPPEAGEALTDSQKKLLKTWIEQGANYEPHWAFVPPKRPERPAVKSSAWPRNAIDHFILSRMEEHGLSPAPEADRHTLIRRLSLDLTGLPPTIEETKAFVNDGSPKAYENLVDRLLASPHYGERWARVWLDLARYADTNGYEKDRPRSIWPYRDWVIRALNADMPYNEFSIKQIAGDMLPKATEADRVATGFHRNTMLNEEGGIDPLEYRFHAMVDRVATTGTVWMGLTTGCAQCHSHKYDALSHTDYYRLMALLNNADEPEISVTLPEIAERRTEVQRQIDRLEAQLPAKFPGESDERRQANLERAFQQWIEKTQSSATSWTSLRPRKLKSNLPRLEILAGNSILSTGDITKRDEFQISYAIREKLLPVTAIRLEALPDESLPAGGPGRAYYEGRKGDFFLSELSGRFEKQPLQFKAASHSYGKISIGSGNANAENVLDGEGSTGWSTAGREGEAHQLVVNLEEPIKQPGMLELTLLFERHFAASLGHFRISFASEKENCSASQLPDDIERFLARGKASWSANQKAKVLKYYLSVAPELKAEHEKIAALKSKMPEYPKTLVFQERPQDNPRITHRHHRGEYLSPREEVSPGIPALFPPLPEGDPANRLTLARWLVSEKNPMAGRLVVNRAWRTFFGNGLVRTNGDYGTQSDPPTHPELLDWLAVEFMEQGWSLKKLHRMIVISATYRQSAVAGEKSWKLDPENLWLSRSPRYLVDAEFVRDIMLKASGLLSKKVGGPSVFPPQPKSVTALAYGNTAWKVSTGEDRYRRSLYTFSKRTAPFAAYAAYNAPTGESCVPKRDKSSTPLQVLTLLNDEMFLEMAQALAREIDTARTPEEIATELFRRLLTRRPAEEEVARIIEFFEKQRDRLLAGEIDAETIAGQNSATPELAAWVMVARALMNLEETITRP